MALYNVSVGGLPLASDIDQLTNIFNGTHDIGQITLAGKITDPTSAPSAAIATGTELSVGAYSYAVTFVTGQIKTDGTLVVTGETLPSPSANVTTTSSNQRVNLTSIPVGSGASVIGRRIYRTAAGGSPYYLIATIKDNTTSTYLDTKPDSSLAPPIAPTANSTGTTLPNITIKGTSGPGITIDAGRSLKSVIYWNATPSAQYGMTFKVDGNSYAVLNNDSNNHPTFALYDGNNTNTIIAATDNVYANIWLGFYTQAVINWSPSNNEFEFMSYDRTAWKNAKANSFITASSQDYKKDIENFTETALDIVKATQIVTYRMKEDDETAPKQIGLIAENSNDWLTPPTKDGANVYGMSAVTMKAVQELNDKLDNLITQLKDKGVIT